MRDTIAIAGTHPDGRELAPWDDEDVDIWVFNEVAGQPGTWVRRWDALFQMHHPAIYRNPHNRCDPNHWKWLQREHGKPVYMLDVDPDVPDSVKYPLDEVAADLLMAFWQGDPPDHIRYFTSSIAYALALAIHKRYKRILVYGIEMSSNTEYTWQRDCVAFWVGMALGMGIPVLFHGGDAIFGRPLYGYDGYIETDVEALKERRAALEQDLEEAIRERQRLERVLAKRWEDPSKHIYALQMARAREGTIEGHLHEANRYIHKGEAMRAERGLAIIDRNEYEGSAAGVREKIEHWGAEVYRTAGRLDYVLNIWLQIKDPEALKQVKMFSENHFRAAYESGFSQGVFAENHRLAQELDYHLTAAGGIKALEMMTDGLPTPARPDG